MRVAARRPRQRDQPAAEAFPLVIGSLRFDPTVEGSHRPGVPMSVAYLGTCGGDGRADPEGRLSPRRLYEPVPVQVPSPHRPTPVIRAGGRGQDAGAGV
jgi:hypothetical protein